MTFGQIFRHHRKLLGYTQEEVANYLMVTPQAVSKWETDLATPDISLLLSIAQLFGITADELLGKREVTYREMRADIERLQKSAIIEVNIERFAQS